MEVERALKLGLHSGALSLALTIPDICSSLEVKRDSDGPPLWKGTDKRYRAWCEKYLGTAFRFFDPQDCWALRGGVLHNGMLHGHPKARYHRIVFLLPGASNTLDQCISRKGGQSVLFLDLALFVGGLISGARKWLEDMKANPVVQENLGGVVRKRYTKNLGDYEFGTSVAVIA